jgi:hypothetical protein
MERAGELREASALPCPPLSTTQRQPVLLGLSSWPGGQNYHDVDGAAHTSENEERKKGDADQSRDLEFTDHSDYEENIGTSEHDKCDDGVGQLSFLLLILIHDSLLLEGMNRAC